MHTAMKALIKKILNVWPKCGRHIRLTTLNYSITQNVILGRVMLAIFLLCIRPL